MRPLDGIKVIDLSTLLPGPFATLILAEAGAEVIKIERIGGEDMRRSPPFIDGESVLFAILNRGKRSIELDIKSKNGFSAIVNLIKTADIVIAVRTLDFGERKVSSGQSGFVKHVDAINGWYHVIWWGDVCLVRRQDIARIL